MTDVPCNKCGTLVAPEPNGEIFCIKCHQQSIWQRSWSVFSPLIDRGDAVVVGVLYFFVTGLTLFFTLVPRVVDTGFSLKDKAGAAILGFAVYTIGAGILALLGREVIGRLQVSRATLIMIAVILSVVSWGIIFLVPGG
jgi:hypothetical protein